MVKVMAYEGDRELIAVKVFDSLSEALKWIDKMGASGVSLYTIEFPRPPNL